MPIQRKFRADWVMLMTSQGKGKVSGQKRQEEDDCENESGVQIKRNPNSKTFGPVDQKRARMADALSTN